jgi:hypothetical protein
MHRKYLQQCEKTPPMKRPPRKRCQCGKVRSSTLTASRLLHARIWANEGGEANPRFYQCRFGLWHWTREELRTTNTNQKAA